MDALARRLNELCDAQPFTTSWYVRDLAGGREASRQGDVPTPSASTRKVSIMMAAFKAAHEGRLDLDEPVAFTAEYQKGIASGTFQHMTPGMRFPLRDAIVQMIITSDNVCTRLVVDRVDVDTLNAYCAAIGLTGTVHRFGVPPLGLPWDHPVEAVTSTTPADQGRLLDMILAGAADEGAARRLGSTSALCRYALDILSWQLHRSMIPALLPFGTKVANKTGRGVRGRMDVGIVYRGERPLYILTAFADRLPDAMPDGLPGFSAAFALIGRLSRACWETLGPAR
ncbi:MAG: serine hydrolase [Alphaproteobacteria bacterium]|nr:serine hydrolase [Alphaproteobacteria bacterium]